VPSIDIKNWAKNRANQMAGHVVAFREVQGGQQRMGRVVGYYYDMAQIVLEVAFGPLADVDPHMKHLQLTANFRSGHWWYTCVDVFLVDEQVKKTPTHPHSCPRCGSPSFNLFRTVECSKYDCANYKSQKG